MEAETTQRGSMGIPEDMLEAGERARKRQQSRRASNKKPDPKTQVESSVNQGPSLPGEQEEVQTNVTTTASDEETIRANTEASEKTNPLKVLSDMGVEFGEDDLQQLLFKGFFEANDVPIVKGHLSATIRTLRGSEYNMIEELLMELVENKPSTSTQRFNFARRTYILCFAVSKLNGKSLANPVRRNGEIDEIATIRAKARVIDALSSIVVDKLSETHGIIHTCVNALSGDPDLLKK